MKFEYQILNKKLEDLIMKKTILLTLVFSFLFVFVVQALPADQYRIWGHGNTTEAAYNRAINSAIRHLKTLGYEDMVIIKKRWYFDQGYPFSCLLIVQGIKITRSY